ncbi:MAG TPA: PAS domain S-box protein, partial [Spirochaetia bacterium]|nr:PAS domain S-box protein [Spirochaetia bacterium]
FLFEILGMTYPGHSGFIVIRHLSVLLSTDLAIFAAYRVVNRPAGIPRIVVGTSMLAYLGLSIATGFDSTVVTTALFLFTGCAYLWLGVAFLTRIRHSRLGKPIVGYAFIVWGLHKLDYPFLAPIPDVVPWAYFIASFLNLVVAIGVLILFYENIREDLLEREAKYRGVFNNHHTIMLLVDPVSGMIVDANEAAATFYGYSVAQLKQINFRRLSSSPESEMVDRVRTSLSGRPGPYLSRHVLAGGFRREVEVFAGPIALGERTYLCAVVHDVSDRVEFEQTLRASEEKFRLIFNNTGDAIFVHDTDGRILETNRVACERLGYSQEEMVSIHLKDILEPGVYERDADEVMLIVKEQGHYAYESVHVARNGRRIPTEVNSSSVDYFGSEAILSVARDITERKIMENRLRQSLKEKEVLIKEIHHRVKNNLQIIDSLLRLQSRYVVDPQDAALFRMSENRVHTMALIHEQLYQAPNLSSIRMRAYLSRLLGHLRSAFSTSDQGIVVEEEIANVLLDIEIASPCALILNELVTNCLKHAFPERREGKIMVRLSQSERDEELILEVADDGIGSIDEEGYRDPKTFGFLLVRNLADQMGARLVVTSTHEGTSVTLTFARTSSAP